MNYFDLLEYYLKYYLKYGRTYNFISSARNSGKTYSQNQLRVKRIKRKVRNRQLKKR